MNNYPPRFQALRDNLLTRGDSSWATYAILVTFVFCVCHSLAQAEEKAAHVPLREIFVPFDDLNIILEADAHRVFLSRPQYEELLVKAKVKSVETAPLAATFLNGQYEATLSEGRAIVRGKLDLEMLQDDLTALPLELGGVGVRKALLDGKPASLGRDAAGAVQLFVAGKGKHVLELELTAPLATSAAQQTLTLKLPTPPAATLKLAVPGNVEVKGGAEVASRAYDMAGNQTAFELLLRRGDFAIVMSLNNRQLRDQKVLVARSVLVDEVTQGYERLHASVSCRVLQGAADKLQLTLPAGFDVTEIASPLLARWEIAPGEGQQTVNVFLREATSDTIVLEVSASRAPVLTDWKFPQVDVVDAAGHVAVLGLLVEDRLQPQKLNATGLLPLDAVALAQALPASVTNPEKGSPGVRQVVTYYAPSSGYALSADFVKLPAELHLVSNSLLLVGEREVTLRGGFALTPTGEKLFEFRFLAPAPWKVTEVTLADGSALPVERFSDGKNGERLVVKVAAGLRPGTASIVNYTAIATPAGWLGDWQSKPLAFPVFMVAGVTKAEGGLAVHVQDDLLARPDKLENLTPLLDNEKKDFGFGDLPTTLAFRYDSLPYSALLAVERTAPAITAQVISMLRVESDHVAAHYEVEYIVAAARTQKLAFSFPDDNTPAEINVRAIQGSGLAAAVVKEFASEAAKNRRIWRVTLAERQNGRVKLAIDFTRRFDKEQPKNLPLPLVRAEDVEYQTGLIAVEGSAELEVSIQDSLLRRVDVGELAAAELLVGRRVVGAYGYVGAEPVVKIDVRRGDEHRLPVALAERAELITQVDAAGKSVTAARWLLRANIGFLEIELPPQATLWTILLDGESTRPQKDNLTKGGGTKLLLDLGAATGNVRDLQVVYESPGSPLGFAGQFQLPAPRLYAHEEQETSTREVLAADLKWNLILPSGYRLLKSRGTVFPDQPLVTVTQGAAVKVVGMAYALAGGIGSWEKRAPMRFDTTRSVASASKSAMPGGYYADDDIQYQAPAAESAPRTREMFELMDESKSMAPATPPPSAMPAEPKSGDAGPSKGKAVDVDAANVEAALSDFGERNAPKNDLAGSIGSMSGSGLAGRGSGLMGGMGGGGLGGVPARQGNYWALEGIGTLPISLTTGPRAQAQSFRSFGDEPKLDVTLVNGQRLSAAAWAVGLFSILLGLRLTTAPAAQRIRFVMLLLLVGALPPLFTSQLDPLLPVFDAAFFAGCLLIPWYLAASGLRAVAKSCPWLSCCVPGSAAIAALLLALVSTSAGQAQEPAIKELKDLKELQTLLLDGAGPVKVPTDAIIIPYDAQDDAGIAKAEKVLVPYEKYVELWNRAFPEKKLRDPKLPTPFALAGATWQGVLGSGEQLSLQGVIELDVFDSQSVQIPFPLVGGVLENATLDGQPAKLQIVQPAEPAKPQAANAPGGIPGAEGIVILHAQGQGRKKLVLTVRLPLSQQGGWRIVEGRIPAAASTAITLTAPEAQTEIRLTDVADRVAYETTAANEKIETALSPEGRISLRWRPRVTEGQVDADLLAQSRAVLDVREDALRLTWQVKCDFRRGTRELFTFSVPKDYTVEQVTGTNIRGWQVKPDGERQTVDVTLLKAASGSEMLTLFLARRGKVGAGDLGQFAAPAVQVASAALQQGELLIRRSPRLEVQTVGNPTLARIDVTNELNAVATETDQADPPAIALKAYQAWRFQGTSYTLALSAAPGTQGASVDVRTLVAVGSRHSDLYAKLQVRPRGQPIFRLRTYLPEGFTLSAVTPSELEWSVIKENDRQLLTAHLPIGRAEPFEVILEGKLGKAAAPGGASAVPFFDLLDVAQQANEVAITADPVDDLTFGELKNVEPLPVKDVFGWVQAVRQPLVKGAVRTRGAGASATWKLTRRPTVVTVRTITNVKMTKQAVLETSLLLYKIEQGSVSELSFLLPERLKNAQIDALLLRQKTIEPATTGDGQPRPGWVRVKLQLQEEVNGDFRVVIAHDRLVPADKETVQPPVVERHPTAQQIVVIENVGRDELMVDSAENLEEIDRQQQVWHELGSNILRAWRAAGAGLPKLVFHAQTRERVEEAQARIGWAELRMAVDEAGTYRAVQQYRVFNLTEQYLELRLPPSARLWTAVVAGELVKPIESNTPGIVRIPLIKTAEGDGDYVVEVKYGGRVDSLSPITPLTVPVLNVANTRKLRVEQNHVRLFLPETYQWFGFDGTLRQVTDEGNLAVSFQEYLNKQLVEAGRLLSSENVNTRLRAQNNLKQLAQGIQTFNDSYTVNPNQGNWKLAKDQLYANTAVLGKLQRQTETTPMIPQGLEGDNRDRLNDLFRAQSVNRAKGNATQFGNNFSTEEAGDQSGGKRSGQADDFNGEWFARNKLAVKDGKEADGKDVRETTAGPGGAPRRPGMKGEGGMAETPAQSFGGGRFSRSAQTPGDKPAVQPGKPQSGQGQGQSKLPQIANDREQNELKTELEKVKKQQEFGKGVKDRDVENNYRYQQRLEQQNAAPQSQQAANPSAISGEGQNGGGGFGRPVGGGFGRPVGGGQPGASGAVPNADFSLSPPLVNAPEAASEQTANSQLSGLINQTQALDSADLGGFRSLDVPLPARGKAYYFMTVGNDVTLSARGVKNVRLERLVGLGLVVLGLVFAWLLTRPAAWTRIGDLLSSTAVLIVMLLASVVALGLGAFPVAAGVVAVATAAILISRLIARSQRNVAA